MNIYAESSAVLAWLFDEPNSRVAVAELAKATRVFASTLTRLECTRAIIRGLEVGGLKRAQATTLLQTLHDALAGWDTIEVRARVIDRAASAFPEEPIRTLDAIHVASAWLAHSAFGPVTMLSLDHRVRVNAKALGLSVAPRSA